MTTEARPAEKGLLNVYDIKTGAQVTEPENSLTEKSDRSMWGQLGAAVRFRRINIDASTGEIDYSTLELDSPELASFLQGKNYKLNSGSILRQEAGRLAEMYSSYKINSEAATTTNPQPMEAEDNAEIANLAGPLPAVDEAEEIVLNPIDSSVETGVEAAAIEVAENTEQIAGQPGSQMADAKVSEISINPSKPTRIETVATEVVGVSDEVSGLDGSPPAIIAEIPIVAEEVEEWRRHGRPVHGRGLRTGSSAINMVEAANIQLRNDSLHPNRHPLGEKLQAALRERLQTVQNSMNPRVLSMLVTHYLAPLMVVIGATTYSAFADQDLQRGLNSTIRSGSESIQSGISTLSPKPEVIVVHLPVVAKPEAEPDLPLVIPAAEASAPKANLETATKTKVPSVAMEKVKIPKGSSISELFEKKGFRWGWSLGDTHRLETIDLMEAEIVANWDDLIRFNNELPANLADLHRLAERARVGDIPSAEAMQDLAEGLHNWEVDAEFNFLNPDQVRETNAVLAKTSNQAFR